MGCFTYYGTVEVPKLSDELCAEWNKYTFRQKTYNVHSQTKTIPLVWSPGLDKIVYHPHYAEFKDFLLSLPLGSGYIQTAILINLPAGKYIPTHVDAAENFKQYHRIHIPLITNPECIFTVGDESRHLQRGEIWEIDNNNERHSVHNRGATDRVHLLIDFYRCNLLISTHNNLMLVDANPTNLHTGSGVYYGAFRGDQTNLHPKMTDIWVVSRKADNECLLRINVDSGEVLDKKPIPSRFTHDAIRHENKVYLADCDGGNVVVLDYATMNVAKTFDNFTAKNHINTLLYDNGVLWCLLHNLGKSILVGLDPETGAQVAQYADVGYQSHGLVKYKEGFLILSSAESSLLYVTPTKTTTLFKDTTPTFLKGLCMSASKNVVYFGASPPLERNKRGDVNISCELVCFDLNNLVVIHRQKLKTNGLLNNIIMYK